MGLLNGIGTAFSVIGNVGGGVFNMVRSAGKLGGKIISKVAGSLVGKLALTAGAVALLTRDPTGEGNSTLSKLTDGFKSFFGSMSDAAKSKASQAGTEAALNATAVAMGAGEAAKDIIAEVSGSTLESSVADSVPAAQEAVAAVSQHAAATGPRHAPEPQEHAAEAQAEIMM